MPAVSSRMDCAVQNTLLHGSMHAAGAALQPEQMGWSLSSPGCSASHVRGTLAVIERLVASILVHVLTAEQRRMGSRGARYRFNKDAVR